MDKLEVSHANQTFISCVCHAFVSIHCCLVITCWERANLLALVCDVLFCLFTTQIIFRIIQPKHGCRYSKETVLKQHMLESIDRK